MSVHKEPKSVFTHPALPLPPDASWGLKTQAQASGALHELQALTAGLQEHWLYRWLLFVRNSSAGVNCSFATAARYKQVAQKEQLLELLADIEAQAQTCRNLVYLAMEAAAEDLEAAGV
jgi:hypothetical protein